ncbi:MAG: hypothetical protein KKA42_13405 [candidate division Zixibacteria bacterium]|nr:hypothetical protein [candidate division Zixibacteria bacterium]
MNINPLAIQSYQHLTRQDRPAAAPQDQSAPNQAAENLAIEPQAADQKSVLTVKAQNQKFSDFLSNEEREALTLLFSRFSDGSRFGGRISAESTPAPAEKTLGRSVDVKV